ESNLDEVVPPLFADLMTEDRTGVDYAPQLLIATASRMILQTPEFSMESSAGSAVFACGNWVQWFLQFNRIPITTQFNRHPAQNIPDTLEECRGYIRSLAVRALTEMIQLTPMAAFPLYELTLTP